MSWWHRRRGGLGGAGGSGALGLRGGYDFRTGSIPSRLHGTIGWEHVFGDEYSSACHSFASSSAFDVKSANYASDSAVIGLGLDFDVTESLRVGASYIGRFSSEERDDTFELKASWSF